MTFEVFRETVYAFQNEGVHDFRLTGGEPTAHPSFGAMLDHLVSRGLRPRLITNGLNLMRMPDAGIVLRNLDSCWVSVYGVSEPSHQRVSRSPFSLADTLAFVGSGSSWCSQIGVSALLSEINEGDLQQFIDALIANNVRRVRFLFAEPSGRASSSKTTFYRDGSAVQQARGVLAELERVAAHGPFEHISVGNPFDLRSEHDDASRSCLLHKRAMWSVAPDGQVYSCCFNVYKADHRVDLGTGGERGSGEAPFRSQFASACEGLGPAYWGPEMPHACPISALTLIHTRR